MIINNNISALNNHRQMGMNQAAGQSSMEKLSSGLRINNAADDAAGLAISEKMRAQIRGLDQASRNAQDGISMLQTAEGALQETQDILQRMRELATQAANDTNVEVDRNEIQKEMNQLTSEINRIGNTTEFNTQNLLDGNLSSSAKVGEKTLAVEDTYSVVSGLGVDTSGINGETPKFTSADGDNTIKFSAIGAGGFDWDDVDSAKTNEIEIFRDGDQLKVNITAEDNDGNKLVVIGDAINLQDGNFSYNEHGVEFSISEEDFNAMNDGDLFKIDLAEVADPTGTDNNVNLTSETVGTVSSWTTNVDDGTNGVSDAEIATGIVVSSDAIEGAASIEINGTGLGTDGTAQISVVIKDEAGNELSNDTFDFATAADTQNWTYDNHGISFTLTHTDAVTLGMTQDLKTEQVDVTEDQSANFQIGANQNQSLNLSINDMRSEALGISGEAEEITFINRDGIEETVRLTSATDVTDGTNAVGVERALDVSSHENATKAITVLNNAIEAVSAERSMLGATQNRLEHTISNLDNASENLQAAESRIRDVDMAREVMDMTKNNILAQASQAMLAQANQAPQSVLQLLG